jgi:hypothetical protein
MSKLLILVHGMGSHSKGWSGSVRATLDRVAARYDAFSNGPPFSARVRVAEVNYGSCFKELVDQWQAKASELERFAGGAQALPKVVGWLRRPLPQDDEAAKAFFWSTAIDPLLYRGFPLVRDRVRSLVMDQVVRCLKEAMADGAAEATVLAHSLGTAVTHDTLHALGSAAQQGNEVLSADRYQFSNLFMLADVCVLGPRGVRDVDPFTSVVRPVPADGSGRGYCQRFFNAWHRWDPFVLAGPFRPTTWGDGYRPIGPLGHFRGANVHAYTHYLDHPAVHVPLINATLGFRAIPAQEEEQALAEYVQIGAPECGQQIQLLKDIAKEFEHAEDDLQELVIRTAEFYAAAKRSSEACRGLAAGTPLA